MTRRAVSRMCFGTTCLWITMACASAVPPDPATSKAVIAELRPGRTMALSTLFDVVTTEAGSRHRIARERFWILAACHKTELITLIQAESGPKSRGFRVWWMPFGRPERQNSQGSGDVWSAAQVRESLTNVQSCDSARVTIGYEQIDIRFDDYWVIREVTHEPILSASDTVESVMSTLRDRHGSAGPSPLSREVP